MAPGHAVVIGGSIAGLTVARALSRHFAAVTVLERDHYPDGPAPRKGLPQAKFLHNLLPGGDEALESLFPGFRAKHVANGAVEFGSEELRWLTSQGWIARFSNERRTTASSRDLVDFSVRQMVATDPRITLRGGTEATGLAVDYEARAVIGVRVRGPVGPVGTIGTGGTGGTVGTVGPGGTDERILPADLVVDAGGRGSRAHVWLTSLGYQVPAETRIDAGLVYASRVYRPRPGVRTDWKILVVSPRPDSPRYGAIFAIEGGRWMAALGGVGGVVPPTDDNGYLDFAAGLRAPDVHDALLQADPLTPVRRYRGTENRRRAWETMTRGPENFVVVGDAACAFNPEFGQGMSIAARTAVAIERDIATYLRRHRGPALTGLAARLQRSVARTAAPAWDMAVGEDLKFATTVGGARSTVVRLGQWYGDRVGRAAADDPAVAEAFLRVVGLVDPPTALLRPSIMVRALSAGRGSTAGASPAAADLAPVSGGRLPVPEA